jgi:formylglycine-generating enzyme
MKRSILVVIAVTIALGVSTLPAPSAAPTPKQDDTYTSKTSGMKFVRIKAGKFTMGSPADEKDRSDDETAHEVTLTKDYYLGIHHVTRGEFRKFVEAENFKTEAEADGKGGYGWDAEAKDWKMAPKYTWRNPGFTQSDTHPVVEVSWNDAVAYTEWLSKKDGRTYRLPTEAEWEYACRAGTKTRFFFGDDDEDLAKFANVADADFRAATGKDWGIKASDGFAFTSPVGSFKPNKWGLFDMHGNVYAWCSDWYGKYGGEAETNPRGAATGSSRVYRGGSWFSYAWVCRSAFRYGIDPSFRRDFLGFRLALVPSGQ